MQQLHNFKTALEHPASILATISASSHRNATLLIKKERHASAKAQRPQLPKTSPLKALRAKTAAQTDSNQPGLRLAWHQVPAPTFGSHTSECQLEVARHGGGLNTITRPASSTDWPLELEGIILCRPFRNTHVMLLSAEQRPEPGQRNPPCFDRTCIKLQSQAKWHMHFFWLVMYRYRAGFQDKSPKRMWADTWVSPCQPLCHWITCDRKNAWMPARKAGCS